MKRQRGRGRKPGGGGGGGGGGGNHGNRPLESNGPEVKIRGTAAQIYEKYSQYARDAQSSGDRVKTENYLQHAEHYYRIMAATMPREQRMQQAENPGFSSGGGYERDTEEPTSSRQAARNTPRLRRRLRSRCPKRDLPIWRIRTRRRRTDAETTIWRSRLRAIAQRGMCGLVGAGSVVGTWMAMVRSDPRAVILRHVQRSMLLLRSRALWRGADFRA